MLQNIYPKFPNPAGALPHLYVMFKINDPFSIPIPYIIIVNPKKAISY